MWSFKGASYLPAVGLHYKLSVSSNWWQVWLRSNCDSKPSNQGQSQLCFLAGDLSSEFLRHHRNQRLISICSITAYDQIKKQINNNITHTQVAAPWLFVYFILDFQISSNPLFLQNILKITLSTIVSLLLKMLNILAI